jgi:hypothetical protein
VKIIESIKNTIFRRPTTFAAGVAAPIALKVLKLLSESPGASPFVVFTCFLSVSITAEIVLAIRAKANPSMKDNSYYRAQSVLRGVIVGSLLMFGTEVLAAKDIHEIMPNWSDFKISSSALTTRFLSRRPSHSILTGQSQPILTLTT